MFCRSLSWSLSQIWSSLTHSIWALYLHSTAKNSAWTMCRIWKQSTLGKELCDRFQRSIWRTSLNWKKWRLERKLWSVLGSLSRITIPNCLAWCLEWTVFKRANCSFLQIWISFPRWGSVILLILPPLPLRVYRISWLKVCFYKCCYSDLPMLSDLYIGEGAFSASVNLTLSSITMLLVFIRSSLTFILGSFAFSLPSCHFTSVEPYLFSSFRI